MRVAGKAFQYILSSTVKFYFKIDFNFVEGPTLLYSGRMTLMSPIITKNQL